MERMRVLYRGNSNHPAGFSQPPRFKFTELKIVPRVAEARRTLTRIQDITWRRIVAINATDHERSPWSSANSNPILGVRSPDGSLLLKLRQKFLNSTGPSDRRRAVPLPGATAVRISASTW